MLKKKIITAFATGTMMLALLGTVTSLIPGAGSLIGGTGVTTNTTASVSNQTGVDVLGNTVSTSTNANAQLGL